ncbi:MFS transporter, partial [candidate division KSB1 bacterium]|nr:MFS transporter [candidate division KSB1 bacterium]
MNLNENVREVVSPLEEESSSPPNAFTLSTSATVALILSMLIVGVSFGAVAPLVSAILENRGFSEYFTGSVTATLSLAVALSSPWVGKLVERHGTRRINVLGVSGQALGFAGLGLALATNEVLLFPVRFGLGMAATMTFIATEVALLRGVAEAVRGRVMAAYGSGFAIGFMLGVFASDLTYEWLGLWCFALVAAIAALFVPLAWRGMRGKIGEPMSSLHEGVRRDANGVRLHWSPLWMALFGAVVFGALDTAISGTYPVEGQRLGMTRSETLRIVGIMAFGMVAGQPFAGWLADKFGARRPIAAVTIFGMLCCFAAGVVSQRLAG